MINWIKPNSQSRFDSLISEKRELLFLWCWKKSRFLVVIFFFSPLSWGLSYLSISADVLELSASQQLQFVWLKSLKHKKYKVHDLAEFALLFTYFCNGGLRGQLVTKSFHFKHLVLMQCVLSPAAFSQFLISSSSSHLDTTTIKTEFPAVFGTFPTFSRTSSQQHAVMFMCDLTVSPCVALSEQLTVLSWECSSDGGWHSV